MASAEIGDVQVGRSGNLTRAAIGIAGVCVLVLSLACGGSLPSIHVKSGSTEIPAVRASYCWSQIGTGSCADAPPVEMLMRDRAPTLLAPTSGVRIGFDRVPKSATLTMFNESGSRSADVPMTKDLVFKVATSPGVYIYVIAGQWPEGHVDYVFKVSLTQ